MTNTYDASDPKVVAASIKASKARDAILSESLRVIMSSEGGRAWMHSLLSRAPVLGNAFVHDPYRTAFNCGEQNVTKQVVAELHACSPELYLQMMKENSHG